MRTDELWVHSLMNSLVHISHKDSITENPFLLGANGIHSNKERSTMTLANNIAQLWAASTPPTALPTESAPIRLPRLPKPLGCELDHRNPDYWRYTADPYGRAGFRRVTCKSCGRFYGYTTEAKKPSR